MLDLPALFDDLAAIGLDSWRNRLLPLLREKVADGAHGKLAEWRATLARLPPAPPVPGRLDAAVVSVGPRRFSSPMRDAVRSLLLGLRPWRKGPFRVGDVVIDSEWRSDLKWDRLKHEIAPLDGRLVLDAGCGNGYYAWRMRGAGARAVVGVDPTLLYVAQFQAIRHWCRGEPVRVLPLRLAELPKEGVFDTTFSMGVLYHQRTPLDHLAELRQSLKQGGELVLETLILPGDQAEALAPRGRYARMRNVWLLPTLPELASWLRQAGFTGIRTVDVSVTSPGEQRATEWMPFQSLSDALDPADPGRTVEGWPAPRRAVVLCRRDT
jgi:tRNA (mo5U34)-methyltransferase